MPNNNRFSPCSIDLMRGVMNAKGDCFVGMLGRSAAMDHPEQWLFTLRLRKSRLGRSLDFGVSPLFWLAHSSLEAYIAHH